MVHIATNSPARLALCDRANRPGAVNGAWWPTSNDLKRELPDLIAVLRLSIGPVSRVVYDPSAWPDAPTRISRANGTVAVDPYSLVASDTIYLVGTHSRDAVLFVLPPSCHKDVVMRLLRTVSDSGADSSQPIDVDTLRRLTGYFETEPSAL